MCGQHSRTKWLRAAWPFPTYEENKLELFKSQYNGPLGENEEDLDQLFCSELVAEALHRLGLLTKSKPSNEYVPKEFAEGTLEEYYDIMREIDMSRIEKKKKKKSAGGGGGGGNDGTSSSSSSTARCCTIS